MENKRLYFCSSYEKEGEGDMLHESHLGFSLTVKMVFVHQ